MHLFVFASCQILIFSLDLVNCKMTLDNEVKQILYNDIPLNVYGDLKNWGRTKTFSYVKKAGAELKIIGENTQHNWHGPRMGCSWAGLLLECDDGLTSNVNNWKAFGSDSPYASPTKNDYSTPCLSISPFHIPMTSDAQKIWPSNGENYAWLSTVPLPTG